MDPRWSIGQNIGEPGSRSAIATQTFTAPMATGISAAGAARLLRRTYGARRGSRAQQGADRLGLSHIDVRADGANSFERTEFRG
jgi:hypothetical protein